MNRPIRDPILVWLSELNKSGATRIDSITFGEVTILENKIKAAIGEFLEGEIIAKHNEKK